MQKYIDVTVLPSGPNDAKVDAIGLMVRVLDSEL